MPKIKTYIYFIIIFAALGAACKSLRYQTSRIEYTQYELDALKMGSNSALDSMLKPYGDSVDKAMNVYLGTLSSTLVKASPNGTLGLFITDAYLTQAQLKFNRKVDVAIMNSGGIRLNSLEAGPVTRGKIFELMPFDNLMVLLELKGSLLKNLFDQHASKGGWPISGATYTIASQKAENILIDGKPLDLEKTYTIATSDYVANGGDENNLLVSIPQINIGYLQRDALIEYTTSFGLQQKNIPLPDSNRIKR